MAATLFGVGVGPGDPELITLKALNTICSSDVLCYITNEAGNSVAYEIVKSHLTDLGTATPKLLPVVLPMKTDRQQAHSVYDQTAKNISKLLNNNQSVAMICEGDPLFYGSFIYIYQRLAESCQVEIIPGISSIHTAAASLRFPLCTQKDRQITITARSSDSEIITALKDFETVVILKAGAARHRIKNLIQQYAPKAQAAYVENVSRLDEVLIADLSQLPPGPGGYFSLFLCRNSD